MSHPTPATSVSAKLADLKPGDVLIADAGFTCLRWKEHCTVLRGEDGEMFVPCEEGVHYLGSQTNEAGEVLGFTLPTAA